MFYMKYFGYIHFKYFYQYLESYIVQSLVLICTKIAIVLGPIF